MIIRTTIELRHKLERAWCMETRSKRCTGLWTPDRPSMGQCVPTALIVQDLFGGVILRTDASTASEHYFNRLPDGREVDLTRDQFPDETVFLRPWEFPRWSMLDSQAAIEAGIREQYELLQRRLGLLSDEKSTFPALCARNPSPA